ncbi:MAG: hypothetical protein GKR98_03305 [Boseongicola sp.]|nr:MAG: hypothetical protein GKR98_03305 [Boseongicola sp.]
MRIITILASLFLVPSHSFGQEQIPRPFASFDLASEQILGDPHDLAIGPDGRLYVADKLNARIAVLNADTLVLIETLADGFLPGVRDVSFGPDGQVALAVSGASMVAVFDNARAIGPTPSLAIRAPNSEGTLFHSSGKIFAMASGVGALALFENSEFVAAVDGHLGAHDVAEGPDGTIWVGDNASRRLVQYAPDLTQLNIVNASKFGFVGPRYLDVTENGFLVVADQESHRILMIDPTGPNGGTLIGVLGDGSPGLGPNKFDDPEGVAVDGTRYFISDSDNNRVVRYSVVLKYSVVLN